MSDMIHSSNNTADSNLFPTSPVTPMTVTSSSNITTLSPHEAFTTAAVASLSRRLTATTEQTKATGDTGHQSNQQQPEHELCDTLLAYELNQLSFQERNSINEEVHGVARDPYYPEETTQLLHESLMALQVSFSLKKSYFIRFRYSMHTEHGALISQQWKNNHKTCGNSRT